MSAATPAAMSATFMSGGFPLYPQQAGMPFQPMYGYQQTSYGVPTPTPSPTYPPPPLYPSGSSSTVVYVTTTTQGEHVGGEAPGSGSGIGGSGSGIGGTGSGIGGSGSASIDVTLAEDKKKKKMTLGKLKRLINN
jgi:hypothetical protein